MLRHGLHSSGISAGISGRPEWDGETGEGRAVYRTGFHLRGSPGLLETQGAELDAEGKEITGLEFYNYREIAGPLADYVKEMGYTHVLIR